MEFEKVLRNLEKLEFWMLLIHIFSFKCGNPVLNSCALERFHSLDLNQCIVRFGKISIIKSLTAMEAVADPRGRGPGPPLPPIFEAPDCILRPKLHIFRADQSCTPPWPNPGSVTGR